MKTPLNAPSHMECGGLPPLCGGGLPPQSNFTPASRLRKAAASRRAPCAIFSAALLLPAAAFAAPVALDDFTRDDAVFILPGTLKETFAVADNALHVAWSSEHGAWTEAAHQNPVALPWLDDGLATECVVSAALDAPKEIVAMSLRFLDARGEVFQWTSEKFTNGATADNPLQIPVAFAAPQARWAGNNDGVMDWPLKFLGYGFVFASKDAPAGKLALHNIRVDMDTLKKFDPGACFDALLENRAAPDPSFLFGICAHLIRVEKPLRDLQVKAIAAAGASVVRVDFAWTKIEPKPGEFNWDLYDDIVAETARHGIEVQALLGFPPGHAVPPETRAEMEQAYRDNQPDAWKIALFGAPEIPKWEHFVRETVARYKGKIRFYEVWNEPDLGFWRGTTDQYIETLRSAFNTIRETDPAAKVMTGGFATVLDHAGRAQNPDLHERVISEASDAFDIHAFHQHGPFSEFHACVDGELARIRAKAEFQRPLWFNETAITSTFWGEPRQSAELAKKIAFAKSRGAMGYTWYNIRNDGNDPADHEHNYGLLRHNLEPKPAFHAWRAAVNMLGHAAPAGELGLGEKIFAPLFKKDDGSGFVAVVWSENPAGVDVGGAVFDAEGAIFDHHGQFLAARTSVAPTPEPVYVVFKDMPRVVSPCVVATPFPAEVVINGPEIVLNTRQNWRSLTDADPNLSREHWRGPDDLGAVVRVGTDRVTVDVRDDKHVQNEAAEMMWKADSVQIALEPGFEIGAALAGNGETLKHCWSGALDFDAAVTRQPDGVLRYEFVLPPGSLKPGTRFNLLVNDNDGALRKGFMRLAPGMGEMKTPADWPALR